MSYLLLLLEIWVEGVHAPPVHLSVLCWGLVALVRSLYDMAHDT